MSNKSTKTMLTKMIVELWKIAVNTSQYSAKKTDYMHDNFGLLLFNRLKELNLTLTDELEYQTKLSYKVTGKRSTKPISKNWYVPCFWGDTFSLDAVLCHKRDEHPIEPDKIEEYESNIHNTIDTVFLFKAQLTGYNQNRFNAANNLVGEIIRVFGNPANKNKRVCFVNFVPKQTVALKERSATIVRPLSLSKRDTNGIPLLELPIEPWIKSQIDEINIYYDLDFGGDFKEQCSKWDTLVKQQDNFIKVDMNSMDLLDNYLINLVTRQTTK